MSEEIKDTGAQTEQVAAVQDEEQGSGLEAQAEQEQEESFGLNDIFPVEDKKVETKTGDDSLKTQQEEQAKPAPEKQKDDAVEKAFAKRLAVERQKLERQLRQEYEEEYGMPKEQAKELVIEQRAKEYMEKNKDANLTLNVAKDIVRGLKPEQAKKETAPSSRAEWEARMEREDAVLEKITNGEASIERLFIPEDDGLNSEEVLLRQKDVAAKAFTEAIKRGMFPIDAYAKAVEAKKLSELQAAELRKTAEKETLDKIKESQAKTLTDTAKAKSQETTLERIKKMTPEQRAEVNRRVVDGGQRIYLSDR